MIADYFSQSISFCQETTLCGRTILLNIERAKQIGYYIEMHYIGVETAEIAIHRVHQRVKNGGHGVDDQVIKSRYTNSFENLRKIIDICDTVMFYDNTIDMRRLATLQKGRLFGKTADYLSGIKLMSGIDNLVF